MDEHGVVTGKFRRFVYATTITILTASFNGPHGRFLAHSSLVVIVPANHLLGFSSLPLTRPTSRLPLSHPTSTILISGPRPTSTHPATCTPRTALEVTHSSLNKSCTRPRFC